MALDVAVLVPHQLDFFVDGRDAILIHEVVTSLVARDVDRVCTVLARLREDHPAHPDLAALALLASVLQAPPPCPPTHATVTACIEEIENRLEPVARRFLGAKVATFLRPVWQALAAAAAPMPYDEDHPRADPAWLCQQYSDWGAVSAAIEAEPDWTTKPLLCCWMGLARHHLGESEAAIRLWLPLCWTAPAVFASHAPALPSAPVREAWSAFERAGPRGRGAGSSRPWSRGSPRGSSCVTRAWLTCSGPIEYPWRRHPSARLPYPSLAPPPGAGGAQRRRDRPAPSPSADQPSLLPRLPGGREPTPAWPVSRAARESRVSYTFSPARLGRPTRGSAAGAASGISCTRSHRRARPGSSRAGPGGWPAASTPRGYRPGPRSVRGCHRPS